MMRSVFVAVAVGFPVVLLFAALAMERVERWMSTRPTAEGGDRS